jgi:hypothetical protein
VGAAPGTKRQRPGLSKNYHFLSAKYKKLASRWRRAAVLGANVQETLAGGDRRRRLPPRPSTAPVHSASAAAEAQSVEAAGTAVAPGAGGRHVPSAQHAHLARVVALKEVLQGVPAAAHAYHHVPTLEKLKDKIDSLSWSTGTISRVQLIIDGHHER